MISSGDMLADRRLEMARQFEERGDFEAAADLMRQAMEIVPGWAIGWFRLGEILMKAGQTADAIETFQRCVTLDPSDKAGAGVKLAILTGQSPDRMPDAYVRTLFDDYATRFDEALVKRLEYRVPAVMREVMDRVRSPLRKEAVLDLGCGTGLAGESFKGRADFIDGVDLSPGMIAEAEKKSIYRVLHVTDVKAWLAGCKDLYDIVLAADVLVYIGDLTGLMPLVKSVLRPGGQFCFSVQDMEGGSFALGADHRYAYSEAYLKSCFGDAGMTVQREKTFVLRKDGNRDVVGSVYIAG
jgi:predicted TPR repeat methyltransferase